MISLYSFCFANWLKELDYMNYLEGFYAWHHEFWLRNNARFAKEKAAYVKALGSEVNATMTDEQMAIFYHAYLTRYHAEFSCYHLESWKRNLLLILRSYGLCWHRTNLYFSNLKANLQRTLFGHGSQLAALGFKKTSIANKKKFI